LRERLRQQRVLLDRHTVLARKRDDRFAGRALALGDDARRRRIRLVVLQRDRERWLLAHVARSMKRPGAACRITGGVPTRTEKSLGSSSAARSASFSNADCSVSRVAVLVRSAHSVTLARSPMIDTI